MPYTPLIIKKVCVQDGKTIFDLHEPLEWTNGVKKVTVPVEFQCDLASVPRVPLAYLVVGGMGEVAGTVHDYLYREGAEITEGLVTRTPTRKEADDVFLTVLGEEGVSWFKRKAMYYAVRGFAGKNWHKRKVSDPFIKCEEFIL